MFPIRLHGGSHRCLRSFLGPAGCYFVRNRVACCDLGSSFLARFLLLSRRSPSQNLLTDAP